MAISLSSRTYVCACDNQDFQLDSSDTESPEEMTTLQHDFETETHAPWETAPPNSNNHDPIELPVHVTEELEHPLDFYDTPQSSSLPESELSSESSYLPPFDSTSTSSSYSLSPSNFLPLCLLLTLFTFNFF
nr:hypothetical protein HmN_000529100 [Hymenolepis microstoma]